MAAAGHARDSRSGTPRRAARHHPTVSDVLGDLRRRAAAPARADSGGAPHRASISPRAGPIRVATIAAVDDVGRETRSATRLLGPGAEPVARPDGARSGEARLRQ